MPHERWLTVQWRVHRVAELFVRDVDFVRMKPRSRNGELLARDVDVMYKRRVHVVGPRVRHLLRCAYVSARKPTCMGQIPTLDKTTQNSRTKQYQTFVSKQERTPSSMYSCSASVSVSVCVCQVTFQSACRIRKRVTPARRI